ncbi:SDR family NAD(P)-dependent oxidoreductase [Marinivivus vitaminiproducens]|uniref:SDR family NAD(P)-dependent oxidoreductase n=1 Tax=Marinivivus vitaminiproducens TaxID=3035935 RepID=UPI00279DC968|nr:glucose 1-dehydrogenase [Geminicoccaceae bacterium SCSIO 64248]
MLAGKVAIVTGGSRGIGAAVARTLAARGAAVVVGYGKGAEAAEAVAADIRAANGRATVSGGDVREPAAADAAVTAALDTFGRLDILVTAAGVSVSSPLAEIDTAQVRDAFDINVLGTVLAIQAAAPHLPEGGRIVTFASRLALNPLPGSAIYAASKAAVIGLTQTVALELGGRGITVNAVAPGMIETDMTREAVRARGAAVATATPLGRIGQPDDVAGIVAFLVSDDARWMTGRTLRADGGLA